METKNREIISFCGDLCSKCPRYVATMHNDRVKLKHLAELWYRLGFRDKIFLPLEMQCWGCNSQKVCSYQINTCEHIVGLSNCGECKFFACEKIKNVFQKSQVTDELCKRKCTAAEYDEMYEAFFIKEKLLTDINKHRQ